VRDLAVTFEMAFGKDPRRSVGASLSHALAANKQGPYCREGTDHAKAAGSSSVRRPILFSRSQGLFEPALVGSPRRGNGGMPSTQGPGARGRGR